MSTHFSYSLLIMVIVFSSCQALEEREEQLEDGAVIEYQINKETGEKNGWFRKYYDGQLFEAAMYREGKLHGERQIFDEDGEQIISEHYSDGLYEGIYQSFYPGGRLKLEGLYTAGSMEGEWRKYYESGQLMEIVTMHDNEENGPFVEYYENGNLKAEGTYQSGDNEHGELKLYDEDGKLERTMDCNKGICRTTWKREDNDDTENL